MRIGFISDTHGDLAAWEKAMDTLGEVDLILHAGDVLYHGVFNPIPEAYDPRGLARALNGLAVPIIHARGNCDSEVDQVALDNHILSDFTFASAEGTRILVNHGHRYSEGELVKMVADGKAQVVHRGHTHMPELRVADGVMLVNAGSCALPKQDGAVPTVGLLEDGRFTIIDIDSGDVLMEEMLPGYV